MMKVDRSHVIDADLGELSYLLCGLITYKPECIEATVCVTQAMQSLNAEFTFRLRH